jgi:hypothetical protein
MKRKLILLLGIMVVALGLVGTPTSWANSLTFQNVTFGLNINGSGDLVLTMTSPGAPGGDWTGATGLAAFEVKDVGNVTGLTLTNWTNSDNSLSANGCLDGNTTGGCFTHDGGPLALNNPLNFTFDIHATTGTFDLTNNTLKVLFSGVPTGDGHGSLLSQHIGVPEPASLLLLGAGLAGLGIWRRKTNKV